MPVVVPEQQPRYLRGRRLRRLQRLMHLLLVRVYVPDGDADVTGADAEPAADDRGHPHRCRLVCRSKVHRNRGGGRHRNVRAARLWTVIGNRKMTTTMTMKMKMTHRTQMKIARRKPKRQTNETFLSSKKAHGRCEGRVSGH